VRRRKSKTVHDAVHGEITLPPLCVAIVDSRQFQRLRKLKQLGNAQLVYPSATHTRFEHSLGVAHKAGMVATRIRSAQPGLGIDDRDILCVQVAGLVHDLGHGPFSHQFETFLARLAASFPDEDPLKAPLHGWRHEDNSVRMFRSAPFCCRLYGCTQKIPSHILVQIPG
jgi:HD superfamily phosphohydrolase